MSKVKQLLGVLLIVALAGCASGGPEKEGATADGERSAADLYADAQYALKSGDYETAIQRLESLEARFPFGNYARQAQLDIAYAYYKYDEPDSAISAADRFIKLYPRNENVDYAYYLKGLVMFDKGHTVFDKLASQDPAKRDAEPARKSFQYFSELVQRFPDSKYADDALQRMVYLRNALARHELYVAQFYMKRGAYVAVINRGKYILETYQRTPSVEDALVLMVQAYRKLGLDGLATDTLRILEKNYPKNPALAKLRGDKTTTNEEG